jgi:thiol-disulfide isomerase/thioredoxin
MSGMKVIATLLLLGFASSGSTCHGQSSSGTDVSKDPGAAVADVNLAEVDTSALMPREKKEWSKYVSELLAPCSDTPVPISQCVQEKRSCNKCVPAAKLLLKAVRDGLSREQVEKSFHNRFDADKVKNVTIDDSPTRGSTSAPIVMVEFADFECPHCQAMAPVLDKTADDRKDQLRFVFKYLPLPGHTHAEPAARAAYAAQLQGKFWEMHQKLFSNGEHLEQSDLEAYARDVGLDLAKFKLDMQSKAATDKIAADKKLADSLGVKGTPTIFINGREYDRTQTLDEWLNLEVALTTGAAPTPAPSASVRLPGSASASGSAAPPPAPSASVKR